MENEDFELEGFTLNIDRCIASKEQPAVIRQLFSDIRDYGYINIGQYFATIAQSDLDILSDFAERIHSLGGNEAETDEDNQAFENLALFGMGLLVGEGRELNADTTMEGVRLAIMYISIESLYRKGLIDVYRENWSTYPEEGGTIARAKK